MFKTGPKSAGDTIVGGPLFGHMLVNWPKGNSKLLVIGDYLILPIVQIIQPMLLPTTQNINEEKIADLI